MIEANNALLMAKDWLTIEETAEYLSNHFGQKVTEKDIFYFGFNSQIVLSVISSNELFIKVYRKDEKYPMMLSEAKFSCIDILPIFYPFDICDIGYGFL